MTARISISRGFRFSCAAAALAMALTACNGGGTPRGSGTPSSSVSETATATATPTPTPSAAYKPADAHGKAQNVPVPVLPEAAKAETKEGLEAFVRYWYSTLSYAFETGDTSLVSKSSSPNCTFCSGLSGGVKTAWQDGRWISGGKIETPSITPVFKAGSSSHQATVQVVQDKIEIHKANGDIYQKATPPSNAASQATVVYGETGWVLNDLGLIR